MEKKYTILLKILLLFSFSYFFIGTGIHGDDLSYITKYQNLDLKEFFSLNPSTKKGNTFFALTSHYTLFLPYVFFNENDALIFDLLKILITCLCIYFTYFFLKNYFPKKNSLIAAIIFIFYPTHESTLFWYTSIIHIFAPCCLLYVYALTQKYNNKLFLILIIPSTFISYSSPPFLIGLIILSLLERKKIESVFLIFFTGIYFVSYLSFTYYLPEVATRISNNMSLIEIFKNLLLKILTTIDTNIGPSFFLKIYFSIANNNFMSILILIVFFSLFLILLDKKKEKMKKNFTLVYFASSILITSMIMMSMTGSYFSSPFNLGNRIVFYFSFFLIIIFLEYLNTKFLIYFLFFIILLPLGGLSNHWKNWNSIQIKMIKEISNTNFHKINHNNIIFLKEANFSKLGFINHIEFFAMPWIVEEVFKKNKTLKCLNYSKNKCKIFNLNNHSLIKNGIYIDKKYKETINIKIENEMIFFYDVQQKTLKQINVAEIKRKINERNNDIRHWVLSPYFKEILRNYNHIIPSKIKIYLN